MASLRSCVIVALVLALSPAQSRAVDVVVDLKAATPQVLDALKAKYDLAEVVSITDFGLFRLRLNKPSEADALALVDTLRKDDQVRHADVAPASDAALFRAEVSETSLSAQQRSLLEEAQRFTKDAFVVQARDRGILDVLLQRSDKSSTSLKDLPVIDILPKLKLAGVTTYYREAGDRKTWGAVVVRDSAGREPIGSVVVSIFTDKATGTLRMWGRITRGSEVVLIRPLADGGLQLVLPVKRDGKHVREDSPGRLRPVRPGVPRPPPPAPPPPPPPPCPPGQTCPQAVEAIVACEDPPAEAPTITLGVLLRTSERAGEAVVNLAEFAGVIVDQINAAFRCSGVKARMQLAQAAEASFTEPATLDAYRDAFRRCEQGLINGSPDCPIDAIYQWRKNANANVVLLLSRSVQNPFAAGFTEHRAFALVPAFMAQTYSNGAYEYDADLIALHELGHVLGGAHDLKWYDDHQGVQEGDDFVLNADYGHAFYRPPTAAGEVPVCTIMAASTCYRDLYWSSPRVEVNGIKMGSSASENVARVISERAETISKFKGAATGPQ